MIVEVILIAEVISIAVKYTIVLDALKWPVFEKITMPVTCK